MRFRNFSMTSQLQMVFPVIEDGRATDKCNLARGLRYKLCGKYRGLQSSTFFIVCIFMMSAAVIPGREMLLQTHGYQRDP